MAITTDVAPRGRITDWSAKSRTRMIRRFCTLDYGPLFTAESRPALVTLTLPHDWETVAGTAEQFKIIVGRFRASYRKTWGAHMQGIWKMEFQYRVACSAQGCHDPRAPHMHILTTIPEVTTAGGLTFREWLGKAWARAVRHPDAEQRRLHELAGTAIDFEDTIRYADAKRIAVYFTKHGMFAEKEYQNRMPDSWAAAETGGARFWGYWGLKPAIGVTETDHELAVEVARHLRKLNDADQRMRSEGVWRSKPLSADEPESAIMSDPRVWADPKTGELRRWHRRKVRRRVRYMRGTRGFLSVNDGVATAEGIARLVDYFHELRGGGFYGPHASMRAESPGSIASRLGWPPPEG